MGLLQGRLTSLVDLKAGFEAEDRLVDMQEEYLRLLGGYQGLEQNIKVGNCVILSDDKAIAKSLSCIL